MKMSISASKKIGDKNSMYGKKHKEESKEKMSLNTIKRFGEYNPNFGREYKEEEKSRLQSPLRRNVNIDDCISFEEFEKIMK